MNLKEIAQFVDFTSLNNLETSNSIKDFIQRALEFERSGVSIAGVCTYSIYADLLVDRLEQSNVRSVVVVGGFPHAQIPLEIKLKEIEHVKAKGIEEVDIVISQHLLHAKEWDLLKKELNQIRKASSGMQLKVILETGHIQENDVFQKTAKICCESEVDFLKTSTGKIEEGANPAKFEILCKIINENYKNTGRKTGIKASGGIRTTSDALIYSTIVENVLGKEFLSPVYFRIGASSLLNSL